MDDSELKVAYSDIVTRWFERNPHQSTVLRDILVKGDPSIPWSLYDMCNLTNISSKEALEVTVCTSLDNIFRKYHISLKHRRVEKG